MTSITTFKSTFKLLSKRFAAYLLDCAILTLFSTSAILILAFASIQPSSYIFYTFMLGTCLYYVSLESSIMQATLGKKLLGLKVVGIRGTRLSLWRACERYFWFMLPHILFWILCDGRELLMQYAAGNLTKVTPTMGMYAIFIMHILWYLPVCVTPDKTSAYDILSSTKVINRKGVSK